MTILQCIAKKRDGQALTETEINELIAEYTQGHVPDYQMAAWLMAVYFQGMTLDETVYLTLAMAQSGHELDLSMIPGIKVDKHSTGGVADTVTLVLAPLVAALNIPVAKMSGRGLGFTGGTIDKLESIQGFKTTLTIEEFRTKVQEVGVAIMGQSQEIAPADGKLYALRDVTGTVASVPLIASSVMSKKIASGADRIVLDVKVGRGAFMKNLGDARVLAKHLVHIGKQTGRKTVAVLTNMNQPLGMAVGNSLEIEEAIETLKGRGCPELLEGALTLGSYMVLLAEQAANLAEARQKLLTVLQNGQALEKFRQFIVSQGGDARCIDDYSLLPQASYKHVVLSPHSGFITAVDAEKIGLVAMALGAGREKKDDQVDLAVGLMLHKRFGQKVESGQPLVTIFANDLTKMAEAKNQILHAFAFSDQLAPAEPLIYDVID